MDSSPTSPAFLTRSAIDGRICPSRAAIPCPSSGFPPIIQKSTPVASPPLQAHSPRHSRATSVKRLGERMQMMNRGGGGGGGALGSGSGPTAAATAAAAQKQKALLQRVETDIGNIVDNFNHLMNVARVSDPPVRNSQEAFMMEMRASRMVQAADSLLKLVSELKQTAIFSGFASLNDHVEHRIQDFEQQAEKSDRLLSRIADEAAASLKELESHYYSSAQRPTLEL